MEIVLSVLGISFLALIIYLYNKSFVYNKYAYLLNRHLLDEIAINYKNNILIKEIEKLKHSHNLDENSQLNARKAYLKAEEELIKKHIVEVYKLLTKENRQVLLKYFSKDSLFLIIINHLRS